jgi:hypothetical protein
MTCAAIDAPPAYEILLDGLPDGVRFDTDVRGPLDFVHVTSGNESRPTE